MARPHAPLVLAITALCLLGPLTRVTLAQTPPEAATGSGEKTTYIIPLEGAIEPSMRGFFERKVDEARRGGADILVLDIDSPGGRLDTTFEIVEQIRELEDIQTVAYIRHSAFSGAAMIALACDRIEMHPEAQMGDVGVIVGGMFSPFQYVEEKQRSPVVSAIRTLAEASGRPPALAEAMVDKDVVVYSATHREDGRTAYFTDKEWDSLGDTDQWEQGPVVFESREGNFLTVNGRRATELGLAESTSRSLDATLESIGAHRPATVLARTWVDSTIDILNSFWMTGLLLVVGLVALLVELSSPGVGIGGLTALLCFALFFWSRFLGGTAGWLEVTLFVTALVFIATEFFLIPGFGFAGIAGIILMVLSLVMASQRVLIPRTGADWTDLGMSLLAVGGALVTVMIAAVLAADHLGNVPLFRRLVLEPPNHSSTGNMGGEDAGAAAGGTAGKPELLPAWERVGVGDLGETLSPLRPSGKAQFAEDILDVFTEGEYVAAGAPIRVLRKQGNRIVVREA